MKANLKKVFAVMSIVLIVIMCSFFAFTHYYGEEQIKGTVVRVLRQSFPKSNIKIDELRVTYGPSIKVTGKNLSSDQFQVGSIEVKTSLFSFITGGGNFEVLLKNSSIDLNKLEIDNKSSEVVVPAFIVNSSGSFRFEDLAVVYSKGGVPYLHKVERFIVKNFGLRSKAAFEIKSSLNFNDKLEALGVVVGTVDINHYLKKKKLPIEADIKLNKIVVEKKEGLLTTVGGRVNLLITENGDISGEVSLKHANSSGHFKGKLESSVLDIDSYNFQVLGEDFNSLLAAFSFPEQHKKSTLKGKGKIHWDKKSFVPTFEGHFNDMTLNFLYWGQDVSGSAKYQKNLLAFKVSSNLSKGKIGLDCETDVDAKEGDFHKFLKKFECHASLYKNDMENIKTDSFREMITVNEKKFLKLPAGNLKLKFKDVGYKGRSLTGEGEIHFTETGVSLSGDLVTDNEWKVKISENIEIFKQRLKRKGRLNVAGRDVVIFSNLLKIDNPLVRQSEEFNTELNYESTVLSSGLSLNDEKKVHFKLSGKGLKLNSKYLIKKMKSVKSELDKWDLWGSVKDDLGDKSYFNEFSVDARRTANIFLISKLELIRGKKKVVGNGLFKTINGTYLGNLDLKVLKAKWKPIKIFMLKDFDGLKLDRKKILKQF